MQSITRILDRAAQGDRQAAEELLPLVYDELRKLAAAKLAREQPGQTLQATALVHDAYRARLRQEKGTSLRLALGRRRPDTAPLPRWLILGN